MSNPEYCWMLPLSTSSVLLVLFLKLSKYIPDMIGRTLIHISSTDKTEFSHRIINFNRPVTQKELQNREFYLCFCSGGSVLLLIHEQRYPARNLWPNGSMSFRSNLVSQKRTREKNSFALSQEWQVPFFSEDLLTLFFTPLISNQYAGLRMVRLLLGSALPFTWLFSEAEEPSLTVSSQLLFSPGTAVSTSSVCLDLENINCKSWVYVCIQTHNHSSLTDNIPFIFPSTPKIHLTIHWTSWTEKCRQDKTS